MDDSQIKINIREFQEKIDSSISLVAVSKTKPESLIKAAYEAGQLDFGENKAQEMTAKAENLPDDIRWHMIGHLQRNKVKYIVPYVHLIHSIDSEKLLKEVNKRAAKVDRVISCLLQVHIAKEESKFGWDEEELLEFLDSERLNSYPNVKIEGLMGMATFTDNNEQVKSEFKSLKHLFDKMANEYDLPQFQMKHLSMGMSGDYDLAIAQGSNMIRVGSKIFGERN